MKSLEPNQNHSWATWAEETGLKVGRMTRPGSSIHPPMDLITWEWPTIGCGQRWASSFWRMSLRPKEANANGQGVRTHSTGPPGYPIRPPAIRRSGGLGRPWCSYGGPHLDLWWFKMQMSKEMARSRVVQAVQRNG
ncbi:hypothetical protein E3N88_34886 [Mikania micrantha]|uniref:Uncharacterized protein n=1 Tax=Mikania micrantha TaxID=192012 RepID=A0A5N6M0A3_9ASTR|nr:hypothetical protein E3N88_34886 [Mikania micrantha]